MPLNDFVVSGWSEPIDKDERASFSVPKLPSMPHATKVKLMGTIDHPFK